MTRDEAIAAFEGIEHASSFGAKAWIDRFVALGMLKIDAPKSADDRFREIGRCYGLTAAECLGFGNMIEKAGLKIVEASSVSRPNGGTHE